MMRFVKGRLCALSLMGILAAASLAPGAEAQEQTVTELPPACPRNLRISQKGQTLTLTWLDSSAQNYAVYRLDRAINAASFADAQLLGEVKAGVRCFVDQPPAGADLYYAIIPLDSSGNSLLMFEPRNNTTIFAISIENAQPAKQDSGMAASPVQASAAGPSGSTSSGTAGQAASAPAPAGQSHETAAAAAAAPAANTAASQKDSPPEDSGTQKNESAAAGLASPAAASQSPQSDSSLPAPGPRSAPLPGLEAAEAKGVQTDMDPDTAKAVARLLAVSPGADEPDRPEISVFLDENDAVLASIAHDDLSEGKFNKAAAALRTYLTGTADTKSTARARFYLGEALAGSGSAEEAFYEFLAAMNVYPKETKPWLDYLLLKMKKTSNQGSDQTGGSSQQKKQ